MDSARAAFRGVEIDVDPVRQRKADIAQRRIRETMLRRNQCRFDLRRSRPCWISSDDSDRSGG